MRTVTPQRSSREFEELAPYLKAVRDFPPLTREDGEVIAYVQRPSEGSPGMPVVAATSAPLP